jgi:hypothetical protein
MWFRYSLPFCGIALKKPQSQSYSLHIVCTREHFWTHLGQPCDDRLAQLWSPQSTVHTMWKFKWKFWNCEVPSFTNFLVNTLNKIITHRRLADHFALHCEHMLAHLWTFYRTAYSSFSLCLDSKLRLIHDRFFSTYVPSPKKADKGMSFAARGCINCMTHQNSLCRDKNKH